MTGDQLFTVAIVGLIASNVAVFMTAIIAPVFNWLTSQESRKRDLEDRHLVVINAQAAVAAAAKAAEVTTQKMEVVHAAVVQVGQQAVASYNEANMANLKIQAVQDALTEALNLPQKKITNTPNEIEKS